ncbi:uncharacterized protein EI90DRAFT_894330 [Cantharellus anzutake]|uniref:uncharacterized protein n=1 Tax=Cantharellus anzutake TaxID=1750568 RepID=UPI00190772EE|nr:uncharacterized protein EI90DRAFT_894330 [Cantharellus anzutake]KAF8331874.1 hypothetical protein EI90DRAFT_894330 [Cantharellus anzutake]
MHQMQIKAPTFLRSSRPASPHLPLNNNDDVQNSNNSIVTNLSRRPLTRLQNPFRRSSSASPFAALPLTVESAGPPNPPHANSATNTPPANSGIPPAHLDQISLRLAEAATKALANPSSSSVPSSMSTSNSACPDPALVVLRGRKPLPAGRGAALGKVVQDELGAACSDPYLYRAILRVLQKPLTVLLSNLSSLLLPVLAFIENSSSAQEYCISLAVLGAEVLEALNTIPMPAGMSKESRVGDGLKGICEGLESLIKRVISPLVSTIRSSLGVHIDTLSSYNPATGENKSLAALGAAIPGAAPRLAKYTTPSGVISQSALATLHIGLVWRALVALSERDVSEPARQGDKEGERGKGTFPGLKVKKELSFSLHMTTRPSSAQQPPASPIATSTTFSTGTSTTTPPVTPRFKGISLPLPSLSRPPSPQIASVSLNGSTNTKPRSPTRQTYPLAQLLSDAQQTQALLLTLPSPTPGCFAREAVNEAYDAFEAFIGFLRWLCAVREAQLAHEGVSRRTGDGSSSARKRKDLEDELDSKTGDFPTLVALPLLLRLLPSNESKKLAGKLTVALLVGMEETEYKSSCLAGFGRAEVCTSAIGRAVLSELAKLRADEAEEQGKEGKKEVDPELEVERIGIDVEVLREWLVDKIASAEAA